MVPLAETLVFPAPEFRIKIPYAEPVTALAVTVIVVPLADEFLA